MGDARVPTDAAGDRARTVQAALSRRVGKRALVIVNPATHGRAVRILAALRTHCPPGIALDVRFTDPQRPIGDLTAERLDEVEVVIACGGDGTVADVVTAVGDTELSVGIIPAGSTNIVARENRIPLRPDAAAKLIFGQHRIARLDVGTCGERRFLHMAGAGLDSRLLATTNLVLKRRVGWFAYVPATLRNVRAPAAWFSIGVDGKTLRVRSPLVLIANGAGIVRPSLPVYPGLRRDDGLLDVVALTLSGPLPAGRVLYRFLTRGLDRSPFVVHLRGRTCEIDSDPILPVQLDGDVVGVTPARFGVLPGAARLIVPDCRVRNR